MQARILELANRSDTDIALLVDINGSEAAKMSVSTRILCTMMV
jgi:hypothetical protein